MTSKFKKAGLLSVAAVGLFALDIAFIGQPLAETLSPTIVRISGAGHPALAENMTSGDTQARTIRVCAPQSAHDACQFNSLADAIKSARSGDPVLLSPGVYRQAVIVTVPDITIKGEPGAHLQGTAIEGKAAFVVRANIVSIIGLPFASDQKKVVDKIEEPKTRCQEYPDTLLADGFEHILNSEKVSKFLCTIF